MTSPQHHDLTFPPLPDPHQQPTFDNTDWPDPQPLPTDLAPVVPFNNELLPYNLRDWVRDIADRMGCPPDYPAVGAVIGLAAVAGKAYGIIPKRHDTGFRVVPNLWGAIVGRPSQMKTPALAAALAPLDTLEQQFREEYAAAQESYAAEAELAGLERKQAYSEARKAVEKGNRDEAHALLRIVNTEPPEPTRRRFCVNDSTVEKLGELLNENPNGLLLRRDELAGFLSKLQREDAAQERAFYLEAWNGTGGFTWDRIGRGTIDVPSACVSVIGTIQPGKLTGLIDSATRQGAGDDGLLQRLQLLVYPDPPEGRGVDRQPDRDAKARAFAVFERLAEACAPGDDGTVDTTYVRFGSDAQALFDEWVAELEEMIRQPDIHPALESHFAKYRSLAPSLALLFELADREHIPDDFSVGANAFSLAAAWCSYLKRHAERIYQMGLQPEVRNAQALLKKLKAGNLRAPDGQPLNPISPRAIQQKGWSGLRCSDSVRSALNLLEEYGWLAGEVYQPKVGRPSERWWLHPELLP
ncbi:YfjI family protein [Granulosicoccaceae sp. 1_MG-2023]|nr:YfjI family protein [Granulosicoccaceae sp. 1_MG-2023]